MENETFNSLLAALAVHLGTPNLHDSGTGFRFKSVRNGKATVYHARIAPGNQAEVAFEVASMAARLRMPEAEFRSLVAGLREATGRPTEPNLQFGWPRVGISSPNHVTLVIAALEQRLQAAA